MGARLTPAETRYANIERELLGVVGALEKFHYFCIWQASHSPNRPQATNCDSKEGFGECSTQVTEVTLEIEQLQCKSRMDSRQGNDLCGPS